MVDGAQACDIDPGLVDLFIDGKENALPDAGRLPGLGLGNGSVVFMLQRPGWCWTACGGDMALSGDGLVATFAGTATSPYQLVTGSLPMTEGRHYWEVEITCQRVPCNCMVGAVRPDLAYMPYVTGAYTIDTSGGGLCGSGKQHDGHGNMGEFAFVEGDRVGMLLDLDAGWLRFYRNDKRCGLGYTEGVTGPLVRAAAVLCPNGTTAKLAVLPCAVAPEGAGAADEPWVAWEAYDDGLLQ